VLPQPFHDYIQFQGILEVLMRTFSGDRYGSSGFGFNIGMTSGVKALLIANIALFVVGSAFPGMAGWFGLTPSLVMRGAIWQLFTYMFLHGGIAHILFNMLALWMFGTVIEGTWGRQRFLRFYAICGVGAGICVMLASYLLGAPGERFTTTIGASGAIYGLLLAFGVMYPNAPILLFFLFPVPAKYAVMIFGAIEFFGFSAGSGGPVSHVAHLGGLLVGYLYMRWAGFTRSSVYRGYNRGPVSRFSPRQWTYDLRAAYDRWNRRRLQKKFEVYLRKRDGGGSIQ
jgi:membrane associated rhomboid family serine protease